jgi:predicted nucleic acid-binding protein
LILDTNAFSAMAEGESALEPILRQAAYVGVPVIVLGEYKFGIAQSRNLAQYERWLSEYLPGFRVLNLDEQTAHRYAEVRGELKTLGKPIPSNDVWIAALCRQHALPILTRDRHFDAVTGITRISW